MRRVAATGRLSRFPALLFPHSRHPKLVSGYLSETGAAPTPDLVLHDDDLAALPLAARHPAPYLSRMANVTLSEAAAARIQKIAAKQNVPAILRLSVEGGGCAGFQYKFGLEDAPADDDLVAETDGVKLVVDPVSVDFLEGSEVDFVSNLGGQSFQVKNPQAASGCGCGTSFSV